MHYMSGEWLASTTGAKFNFVHYKGGGPSEIDLLAGRIDATAKNLSPSLPLIKSQKVRVLAILTEGQTAVLPDVRPVAELYPGYRFAAWIGLVAPAGTPAAIVDSLNASIRAAITTPKALARWESQGAVVVGSSPAAFRKTIAAELAVWDRIVKTNNIKVEDLGG